MQCSFGKTEADVFWRPNCFSCNYFGLLSRTRHMKLDNTFMAYNLDKWRWSGENWDYSLIWTHYIIPSFSMEQILEINIYLKAFVIFWKIILLGNMKYVYCGVLWMVFFPSSNIRWEQFLAGFSIVRVVPAPRIILFSVFASMSSGNTKFCV